MLSAKIMHFFEEKSLSLPNLETKISAMKNTLRFLLLLTMALPFANVTAQVITKDSRLMEKNIAIGFKGGVNAMDMAYKNAKDVGFVNPSALYQGFDNLASCLMGGVYVERVLPRFSYGLEFMVNRASSKAPEKSPNYCALDSAAYANIRVPLKARFLSDKVLSPYIFVAPGMSTYIGDSIMGIDLNGYSFWNGQKVLWGEKNTTPWNLTVTAGAGVEGKIPVGLYEFWVRFEGGYSLGLLNMCPSTLKFERRTRGWEATIGVAFPLFINPSYSWFN